VVAGSLERENAVLWSAQVYICASKSAPRRGTSFSNGTRAWRGVCAAIEPSDALARWWTRLPSAECAKERVKRRGVGGEAGRGNRMSEVVGVAIKTRLDQTHQKPADLTLVHQPTEMQKKNM
jgi:hypothetical protein